MLLPALHVRVRQTLHESRQVAIGLWPKNEVPMIRHNAIGTNTHRLDFECLGSHTLEGGVIIVVIEQSHSADTTIENVEDHSTRSNT